MTEPRMMDPIASLRKIARELLDIDVAGTPPSEVADRIGAASFLVNWIADGLERQFQHARNRQPYRKELNG